MESDGFLIRYFVLLEPKATVDNNKVFSVSVKRKYHSTHKVVFMIELFDEGNSEISWFLFLPNSTLPGTDVASKRIQEPLFTIPNGGL